MKAHCFCCGHHVNKKNTRDAPEKLCLFCDDATNAVIAAKLKTKRE